MRIFQDCLLAQFSHEKHSYCVSTKCFKANNSFQIIYDFSVTSAVKKPHCTVCPHIVSTTTLWKERKRSVQSKHRPIKRMSPPTPTHRRGNMRVSHESWHKKHKNEVCVLLSCVTCHCFVAVYGPSTCSIVRLQARLRVHSTHDEIVGETARSRARGRCAAAHPRWCVSLSAVCGRFTAAGRRGCS